MLGCAVEDGHLGSNPAAVVRAERAGQPGASHVEQVPGGKRKWLKTDASMAPVPLSPTMAARLTELRPEDAAPDAPVFPSKPGTALNYSNV